MLRAGCMSEMPASPLGGVAVAFSKPGGIREATERNDARKTKGSGKSDQPAGSGKLERSVLVVTAS